MKHKISILLTAIYITVTLLFPATVLATNSDPALAVEQKDGEYSIDVTLEGGSGKASVISPTVLNVRNGKAYAVLTWSSSNYDYMIVNDKKYTNLAEKNANSTFEIPITAMDTPMSVTADTLAMGTPHEIEYQLTFYSESFGSKNRLPQEGAKRVVFIALFIIIGGGILNHFVKKRYYA